MKETLKEKAKRITHSKNARIAQAVDKILNFKDLTYAQQGRAIKVAYGRISNEASDELWRLEEISFVENHSAVRMMMGDEYSTDFLITTIDKSGMITLTL